MKRRIHPHPVCPHWQAALDIFHHSCISLNPRTRSAAHLFHFSLFYARDKLHPFRLPAHITRLAKRNSDSAYHDRSSSGSSLEDRWSALNAAQQKAEALGYTVIILNSSMDFDDNRLAGEWAQTVRSLNYLRRICLLGCGDVSLIRKSIRKRGSNRQFILAAAQSCGRLVPVTLLSACTTGRDGNTAIAGAICRAGTGLIANEPVTARRGWVNGGNLVVTLIH